MSITDPSETQEHIRAMHEKIIALGAVPVTNDLLGEDSENRLWRQLLSLLAGVSAGGYSLVFAQTFVSSPNGGAAEVQYTEATPANVQYTFAPGALNTLGKTVRITIYGNCQSILVPPDGQLVTRIRANNLAGQIIAEGLGLDMPFGGSNWVLETSFTVVTTGALGALKRNNSRYYSSPTGSTPTPNVIVGSEGLGTIPVDLTAALPIVVTGQTVGPVGASYVLNGQQIEVLN